MWISSIPIFDLHCRCSKCQPKQIAMNCWTRVCQWDCCEWSGIANGHHTHENRARHSFSTTQVLLLHHEVFPAWAHNWYLSWAAFLAECKKFQKNEKITVLGSVYIAAVNVLFSTKFSILHLVFYISLGVWLFYTKSAILHRYQCVTLLLVFYFTICV